MEERTVYLETTAGAGQGYQLFVSQPVIREASAGDDEAARGVEFLLTWNVRHIANATMRQAIERVCREAGYEPPVICTPEELTHDDEH